MTEKIAEVMRELQDLPDTAKLQLVDALLAQVDRADGEMNRIWNTGAARRWKTFTTGRTTFAGRPLKEKGPA